MKFSYTDRIVRATFIVGASAFLIGLAAVAVDPRTTSSNHDDRDVLVATARLPLVVIAGQNQQLPPADFLSTVGGLTVNATPASAPGDIEATTIAVTQTDIGQTSNRPLVNGTNTGSYDTTAGIITSTTYNCTNSATRSAGAFGLNNVCIDASTSGGQFNVSFLAETGIITQGVSKANIPTLQPNIGLYVLNDGGAARSSMESVNASTSLNNQINLLRADGTAAAKTIVVNGDQVGAFNFQGWDGAQYQVGAEISASVDGVPGASDMPMSMTFSTAFDGTATIRPRMQITNGGHILFPTVGAGTTPAVTACGAGAAVAATSTDNDGTVTEGTIATGCVITFVVPWALTPNCVVKELSGLGMSYTISTTAITVTNVGALSSTSISWVCFSKQ